MAFGTKGAGSPDKETALTTRASCVANSATQLLARLARPVSTMPRAVWPNFFASTKNLLEFNRQFVIVFVFPKLGTLIAIQSSGQSQSPEIIQMPDIASISFPPINRLLNQETRTSKFDVSAEVENRAQELLESHPHFRGRARWVQCRCSKRRLYLTGKVPSYYLKQLAQEAVRDVEDVDIIVNRIVVASPVWRSENPVQDIGTTSASLSASPRSTAR